MVQIHLLERSNHGRWTRKARDIPAKDCEPQGLGIVFFVFRVVSSILPVRSLSSNILQHFVYYSIPRWCKAALIPLKDLVRVRVLGGEQRSTIGV